MFAGGPAFVTETDPFPFDGLFDALTTAAFAADNECEDDMEGVPADSTGAETEGSIRGGVEGTPA